MRVLVSLAFVACSNDGPTIWSDATDTTNEPPGPTDGPPDGTDTDTLPPPGGGTGDAWINEFMASNTLTLQDEGGAFPDWVEIHNPGAEALDLTGWTFTDDAALIAKWAFAAGTEIPAGGYLVLFCDADVDQGPLHTSFQLNAGGEDLLLLDPAGNVVDQILAYAEQASDVSLSRMPDGGSDWLPDPTPTPGASNL